MQRDQVQIHTPIKLSNKNKFTLFSQVASTVKKKIYKPHGENTQSTTKLKTLTRKEKTP